jgi:hypothetical protein
LRRLAAIVAIVTALLAGCGGGGGSKTAEEQVRAAYREYSSAFLAGDYGKVCLLTGGELKARIRKFSNQHDCRRFFKYLESRAAKTDLSELKRSKITSIRIQGDTAIVTDSTNGDNYLAKENGKWLAVERPDESQIRINARAFLLGLDGADTTITCEIITDELRARLRRFRFHELRGCQAWIQLHRIHLNKAERTKLKHSDIVSVRIRGDRTIGGETAIAISNAGIRVHLRNVGQWQIDKIPRIKH